MLGLVVGSGPEYPPLGLLEAVVSHVVEVRSIEPAERPVDADISLPGSKSYTNRTLLVAALAAGRSTIDQALFSDDTDYMIRALRALDVPVEADPSRSTIVVDGVGGPPTAAAADLFVGNAGTAARFLTAYVAVGRGRSRIDGVPRMRERPIGPLLDALQQLGVEAVSERHNDCPPIIVSGKGIDGGPVDIAGDVSSQFISALL